MAVYAVTGKLGAGKSLYAVFKIQQYLFQKRRVACNFDISIGKLLSEKNTTANVCRLPDMPTADDIRALGRGDGKPENSDFYDESKFGVIVLDEAALWLNSHDYNKGAARDLFNLFILIRKMCWDVYILIQNIDVLNSQIKKSICEHVVYLMRLDRMKIPGVSQIGFIVTLGFWKGHLPRMHHAVIRYGLGASALRVGSEQFRGTSLYGAYNTRQKFDSTEEVGTYCVIPPGRIPRRIPAAALNWGFIVRATKIYWRRLNRVLCVLVGATLATGVLMYLRPPEATPEASVAAVQRGLDQYRSYKIVSSRNFNGDWYYELSDGSKKITSDDLISLGIGVYPLGAGQLRLESKSGSFYVFR